VDSQWTVTADEAGTRLDKFLAAPDRAGSRGRAVTALERGKVIVNGADAGLRDAARRLAPGDVVRLWIDRPGSARRRPDAAVEINGLHILFEDDDLLVVNKPAGLLAVPLERKVEAPSVLDQIEAHLRSHGKRRQPLVVHRIDRDTSGIVVFAKHVHAQQALKQQFKRREPERLYAAIVYGHPSPASGRWIDHLVWDRTALIQKETSPRDPNGKQAVSDYRVIETFTAMPAAQAVHPASRARVALATTSRAGAVETALIDVRLMTGRRNQIRIQARLRGHTLVGERRYVFGPDHLRPIVFARQALHARRLKFRHTHHDRELEFDVAMPADMQALLERLRRGSTV
jgi:23S rRNA pseudouridine1911/1915/1917 synthase